MLAKLDRLDPLAQRVLRGQLEHLVLVRRGRGGRLVRPDLGDQAELVRPVRLVKPDPLVRPVRRVQRARRVRQEQLGQRLVKAGVS